MSQLLQYNYAKIDLETGRCKSCGTSSYEINHPAYILVPEASDDYLDKYYNNGLWYEDSGFTVLAEGLN